jgi:translation initiation factor IF-2
MQDFTRGKVSTLILNFVWPMLIGNLFQQLYNVVDSLVVGNFIGKITRNTKVRIIRDGIVIYNGHLSSMKRFKDDVREVAAGYECGLSVENFNDIKVNDIIEGYEIIEQKAKL